VLPIGIFFCHGPHSETKQYTHFSTLKLLTSGVAVVTDVHSVSVETNHKMTKKQAGLGLMRVCNDGMEIPAAF
jgi:hypothetical protein